MGGVKWHKDSSLVKINLDKMEKNETAKNISNVDRRASHKNPRLCPVCTSKLEKIGKGTRFKNSCLHCNAVLAKELKCKMCGQNKLWRGSKGIFCHGCGCEQVST